MGRKRGLNTETIYITEKLQNKIALLPSYPCTLLEAPMGYGKTTAVREFLKNGDFVVLWHRITEGSLTEFWTVLCKLVANNHPNEAEQLMKIGFPLDNMTKDKAIQIFVNIQAKTEASKSISKHGAGKKSDTIVVFDDYHLIECEETNALIEHLLFSGIKGFHIVITSRFTQFYRLEELTLKGYILHIKKELFEFSPEEIGAYYKKCGLTLNPQDSLQIYNNTEGWVSALYLLLLNYKDEGHFTTTQNIVRLIEKTIYQPLQEDVKDFLKAVSILDSFSLKQATHMWARGDAKSLMEKVIERNAFVNYDIKTNQYHVHHMFSEFLKVQFDQLSDEAKYEIYCRAGQWHMNQGEYFNAMRMFHKGKDFGFLLIALERDLGHSIRNDNIHVFMELLNDCPIGERLNHPIALLISAITLFCLNEMADFPRICGEYLESVQRPGVKDANELMGEFEILMSLTTFNNINLMLEHVTRASDLMTQTVRFLDQKNSWTFGAPSVLYMFYREAGGLEQAVKALKIAMPKYYEMVVNHGKGSDLVMEAEYYFHFGDIHSAEILAIKALRVADKHSQQDIVLCASFLLSRIDLFIGNYNRSIQRMEQLREVIDTHQLGNTLDLCDAFLKSLVGITEGVPTWIVDADYKNSNLNFPVKSFLEIISGRFLINNGHFATLIGNSEAYLETAEVFPNLLAKLYILIYRAIAYQAIGRPGLAMESLKQALDIGAADKLYLPFVENGAFLLPLLNELHRHVAYYDFIKAVHTLYHPYEVATHKIMKKQSGKRMKLAGRELEIAKLAAEGLTNVEIGNRLFITQNTVKTQLKRIFQKLEIGSREQLKDYLE